MLEEMELKFQEMISGIVFYHPLKSFADNRFSEKMLNSIIAFAAFFSVHLRNLWQDDVLFNQV
jgi:hypothetical protein